MATLGDSCISRSGGTLGNQMLIWSKYTFPSSGHITSWCFYNPEATSCSAKLKVFRDDGTNWVFVGQTGSETMNPGLNSGLAADIYVQSGDYIALWISGLGVVYSEGSPEYSAFYRYDEVSSTTLKSSWSDWSSSKNLDNISFQVTYSATLNDVYVNSSTGSDSNVGDSCVAGHPVQTFGKAYSLLAPGGTIHCCNDADFSGETVTLNKSFSMDRNGSAGYFYMPQAS